MPTKTKQINKVQILIKLISIVNITVLHDFNNVLIKIRTRLSMLAKKTWRVWPHICNNELDKCLICTCTTQSPRNNYSNLIILRTNKINVQRNNFIEILKTFVTLMHVGSLGYVPPVRTSTAAGRQNVGNLKNTYKKSLFMYM